jgi:hypothetical protein
MRASAQIASATTAAAATMPALLLRDPRSITRMVVICVLSLLG